MLVIFHIKKKIVFFFSKFSGQSKQLLFCLLFLSSNSSGRTAVAYESCFSDTVEIICGMEAHKMTSGVERKSGVREGRTDLPSRPDYSTSYPSGETREALS